MNDKKQINVLLVDDEADYSETMGFWLNAKGYEVQTACSGREAIEIIKLNHPDIVFLDVMMPEMDGIETLRKIRSFDKDLCVIMVTAYATKDKMDEANNLGVSGFFRKSADFTHAAEMIEKALQKFDEL